MTDQSHTTAPSLGSHYFRSLCQDVSDAMEFNTTIPNGLLLKIRAALSASTDPATACLSVLASGEPCRPATDNLRRCTICGFVVDVKYEATKPEAFTTAGRTATNV